MGPVTPKEAARRTEGECRAPLITSHILTLLTPFSAPAQGTYFSLIIYSFMNAIGILWILRTYDLCYYGIPRLDLQDLS